LLANVKKIIKDWLTESGGQSYCPWNFCGIVAILTMSYKLAVLPTADYQSFGIAIGAIIASIAGKRWTEHSEDK
jgi:hypothetical protein